jgi:type VI secretion system secreted protein Hcp
MAASDFFLKIDGIEGESSDDKHKGSIDIEGWHWSESQMGGHANGGGGGAGKVSLQDLSFTMKVNKASPKLLLACASGEHFKKAVLTCRKAGKQGQEYLKFTLSDLLVSAYQTGGNGQSKVIPVDSISLNFARIEIEYRPQNADGSLGPPIKTGWDQKANKAV